MQQRNERFRNVYRGETYTFGGLTGIVKGVFLYGALFDFGKFKRFLTWWEIGKATTGELVIALRE